MEKIDKFVKIQDTLINASRIIAISKFDEKCIKVAIDQGDGADILVFEFKNEFALDATMGYLERLLV